MKNKIILVILILSMITLIFSGCDGGNLVTPPIPDDESCGDLQKWLFGDAQNVTLTAKWDERNCNIWGPEGEPLLKDCRHTGIDYGAPEGTPVYSATEGTVKRVEHGKDCNELACLSTVAIYNEATKVTFIYLHMKDIKVKKNDEVKAGDQIAAVGSRGPGGIHLHFEARPGPEEHLYASLDVLNTINPYEAAKKARAGISPEIPRVLFDDTHNPINGYASISSHFAPLISYLEDAKYIVEIGDISNLEDYDILVLADPHVRFNTSEITSIRTFLQKGGKLVMLGEHGEFSDNSAINALSIALGTGITLNQDVVCDDTDNYQDANYFLPLISDFVSHVVTTDISTVVIGCGSSLNVTSPATVVAWSDPDSYEGTAFNKQVAETITRSPSSKPMLLKRSKAQGPFIIIAVSEVNDGKVFVVGDTNLWSYDVYIDFLTLYDNEKLAKNVFSW